MASLWKVPILYVLENNHIAQTTPAKLAIAGKISDRFNAFGIPAEELETADVLEISPVAQGLLTQVRMDGSPRALILNTHRFGPHSKGDDTRDTEMLKELWQKYDPIRIHGRRLDEAAKSSIEAEVKDKIQTAFEQASRDPFPV